jgi:hypothetical protein
MAFNYNILEKKKKEKRKKSGKSAIRIKSVNATITIISSRPITPVKGLMEVKG